MNLIKSLFLISCVFLTISLKAENNTDSLINKNAKIYNLAPQYSKKIFEGGFYVHLGVMLPTKNYFMPKGTTNKTSERFNVGGGLEIGNLFQLVENSNNTSLGLRITLINALYTTYSKNGKTIYRVLQGSAFDFGPCFSIGLDKHNAIDIYYQFCPTYMYDTEDTMTYAASGAFGLNHEFGLGYRFNLLSIGAVYNLGHAKYIDAQTNDKYMKPRLDHFRFYVGMMF